MIRCFRSFVAFLVIFNIAAFSAAHADLSLTQKYRNKDFSGVVETLSKLKRPLTSKERTLEILSYGHLGELNKKIRSIRKAIAENPKKDSLKRELAFSLESKAVSYADTKSYEKIKKKYQDEAATVLSDLYLKSSTSANFTALIQYYNRQKNYNEALGLLEIYARSNFKGKIYYAYLCEAQYHEKLYDSALSSCSNLVELDPLNDRGHVFIAKSLEFLGEKEQSDKKILKLAGRFPASAPVQLEVGKVLISQGKNKMGLKHLDMHLKKEVSDEALVLKAQTQFDFGDKAEALKTFVRACKQHKEPRKPLFRKMQAAIKKIEKADDLKRSYERELGRCKYSYRPIKPTPKGLLGGRFLSSKKSKKK